MPRSSGSISIAVSDHFQPWRHTGGHSPAVLPWLGALTQRTEPRVAGNLGADADDALPPVGRRPGVRHARVPGTGTCLSRRGHGGGDERDAADRQRVAGREGAAIAAARVDRAHAPALDGGARDVRGRLLPHRAGDGLRPAAEPVPVFVAASGPLAAKLAGRVGDGFICTSGKQPELYRELLDAVAEGAEAAGRDANAIVRMIEIKVSYDHDADYARDACRWWAALSLTPEEKTGVEDPVEMERLADAAADRAHTRFIVSDDAEQVAAEIGAYTELGFTHLVFHAPGEDQRRFLDQFCADVVPLLR